MSIASLLRILLLVCVGLESLATANPVNTPSLGCRPPNSSIDSLLTTSRRAAYRSECEGAAEICCLRHHRARNCETGKRLALAGHDCGATSHVRDFPVTPTATESYTDCCTSCSLGVLAARKGIACTTAKNELVFGAPYDTSFGQCCNRIRFGSEHTRQGRTGESNLLTTNPYADSDDSYGACSAGYRRNKCGRCEDIDECAEGLSNCDRRLQVCRNLLGRFECLLKEDYRNCPPGYRLNGTNQCQDLDECLVANECSPSSESCVNVVGGYYCIPRAEVCTPHAPAVDNQIGRYRVPCPANETARHGSVTTVCYGTLICSSGQVYDAARERCIPLRAPYARTDGVTHTTVVTSDQQTIRGGCPRGKVLTSQGTCRDVDCAYGQVFDVLSQRCQICPSGTTFSSATNKCQDINECEIATHNCHPASEKCLNRYGSYDCVARYSATESDGTCRAGFRRSIASGLCEDVDECEQNTASCAADQTCINTDGGYLCSCSSGYIKNSVTNRCEDLDECSAKNPCPIGTRCENTLGGYHCHSARVDEDCPAGYAKDKLTGNCLDMDECVLGTHDCRGGFTCRNLEGSYRCDRNSCPHGYEMSSEGECRKILCAAGLKYNYSSSACDDVNECDLFPCLATERCVNTWGGHHCEEQCAAGTELTRESAVRYVCKDIDECARGIHTCDREQNCINTFGSYTCSCPAGFELNANKQCVDVDECAARGTAYCPVETSVCRNTLGGYECDCKPGFEKDSNGKYCVDMDECARGTSRCNHKCFNTYGAYVCTCEPGFELAADNRTCLDVDECNRHEYKTSKIITYGSNYYVEKSYLCHGYCTNTAGSYYCSCPPGYTLDNDKRTCQDVNECENANQCRTDEICLNTRGGYRCNRIDCPVGYYKDPAHKNRCKLEAISTRCIKSVDCEEIKRQPLSFSYNYLTFPSKMPIGKTGKIDLFTMRGPRSTATSTDFDLRLTKVTTLSGSVSPARRSDFALTRSTLNEATIGLVGTLDGPQEIELDLEVKMYHNGFFSGKAVAKVFITVTEHEF